jgi:hypothetical protein
MHKMTMRFWALVAGASLGLLLYFPLWDVIDEGGVSYHHYLYGKLETGGDGVGILHSCETWGEIAFILIIFLLLLLAFTLLPLTLAFRTRCMQGIVILFAMLTLLLLFQLVQLFYGSGLSYRNFHPKGIKSWASALLSILRSRFYLQMQHKLVRAAGRLR